MPRKDTRLPDQGASGRIRPTNDDPTSGPREAHEWAATMAEWHDTWGWYAPVLLLLSSAMLFGAGGWWLASDTSPDTVAWLTGIAAVISSVAAVLEAKRAAADRHVLADHEVRLRVLEDARTRQ